MRNRFTRSSRLGRGSIPKRMRQDIYRRDDFTCVFCGKQPPSDELTIDHLVPLALGGLDEMTNYVTCCRECNQRKADQSLADFAASISMPVGLLPVHGDPIIDNEQIPIEIRWLRKRIYDKSRIGEVSLTGKSAQKKLEKTFRREFWYTPAGRQLENEFPSLPGHVRVMIPEIQTIAKDRDEFLLLVELAKSANTRNLIGPILTPDCHVEDRVKSIAGNTKDAALAKRLRQALKRYDTARRRYDTE